MDIAAPAEGEPASGPEEPGWEDKPRRASATEAPVLRANGFEWPLDWLLEWHGRSGSTSPACPSRS